MQGRCLCESVAFEISGRLPRMYQCHCSLCRKQGGSSSNAGVIVEKRNFRWIAGQDLIASFVKPTGFRSDFCTRCGSPVPNPLRTTDYYWVPAGLLDESQNLEVGAHIFVGSKAPWDVIPASGRHYETMPEMLDLIGMLHSDR